MVSLPRLPPGARSALFDVAVAALVMLLGGIGLLGPRAELWLHVIGMAMAAAVLFRRRYPMAVMVAVSALALLQVLLTVPVVNPTAYNVAVLIAMYAVVKYGRRRRDAFLAGGIVAVGTVIMLVTHVSADNWLVSTGFFVGVCGGVWLMGYTVRTRRLYIRGLEERAATAERERDHLARIAVADERAAIARELHDVIAHSLGVMIAQADGASYAPDAGTARTAAKQVATTGREALADMRRLVGILRAAGDGETDRHPVTLDRLGTLVERAAAAGLAVTLDDGGPRPALPPTVELTCYRVIQEAMTNVLRHAGTGAAVTLRLRYRAGPADGGEVGIEVVDDGGGHLATAPPVPGGHGLVGMRERVALHGGTFAAGPRLAGGWQVTATVPWERRA